MAPAKTAPRRRLTAEQRRERILRGAAKVFADRGYHDASMTAIARAGGITPAVVYDHFESKAQLQVELLERETAAMLSAIAAALESAPEDPEARVRAGVDAFFGFVEEHRFAWRMIFRDPPAEGEVQRAYRRLGAGVTSGVESFLRADAPPGLFDGPGSEHRAAMFAQLLTSSMTGLAFWWYEHRDVPRDVVVARVLEVCWTGLGALVRGE
jgi:AcrR family transcriptional regulator